MSHRWKKAILGSKQPHQSLHLYFLSLLTKLPGHIHFLNWLSVRHRNQVTIEDENYKDLSKAERK